MSNGDNGISMSGVDGVVSAFETYKSEIENYLNTLAEQQNYKQAYRGFDKAVEAFVNQVCESVRAGLVIKINNTIEALKTAKEEYVAQGETMNSEITGASGSVTFDIQ